MAVRAEEQAAAKVVEQVVVRAEEQVAVRAEEQVAVRAEEQVAVRAEEQAAAKVVEQAQSRKVKSPLKPLVSFSSLLNGGEQTQEPQQSGVEPQQSVERVVVDEDCQAKLESARQEIMKIVAELRPRFVATFEAMTFSGGVINIAVPTSELEQEILRSQSELLLSIVRAAGIKGRIELRIELNEQIRATRPIKIEDKVAHILKANPMVEELRRRLDLMIE